MHSASDGLIRVLPKTRTIKAPPDWFYAAWIVVLLVVVVDAGIDLALEIGHRNETSDGASWAGTSCGRISFPLLSAVKVPIPLSAQALPVTRDPGCVGHCR